MFLEDLFGRLDEEGFSLSKVIRPAQYIPENLSVYNALELMRTTGGRYGIVTDEFGSIEGIVTFKDIIKALVGSMPEAGEEQDIVARDDGSYLIDGQIPFYDFLAFFDQELQRIQLQHAQRADPRRAGTYPANRRKAFVAQFQLRDSGYGCGPNRQSPRIHETGCERRTGIT